MSLRKSEPLSTTPLNWCDYGVLVLLGAKSQLEGKAPVTTANLAPLCGWTTSRTAWEIARLDMWGHLGMQPERNIGFYVEPKRYAA